MGLIAVGDSVFFFVLHLELRTHHLYSLIITHDDFDSVDPNRMQDVCHI